MIKSIELINWKTHRRTVMNFQKGVNVLIGVMGAGKSSVIDGISFGLFGTFPSLSHKRTTTENLISSRPDVQENAEVKIKFDVGGDEYVVTRKISRKDTASAKLEKNGNYLQTQSVRVNEEIENLLKLNYDTFSRAIYAEQNRVDYFLELPRSERKKQIDQMLGLDNFATAEQNATSLINSIRAIIAEDEQVLLQTDSKELTAQLERLTKERQSLDKERAELSEKAKNVEASIAKLQKQLEDTKTKFEKSKRLEKEIAELSSKIETLSSEIKKIVAMKIDGKGMASELADREKRLEDTDSEIRKLRKAESDTMRELADAEAAAKLNEKKSIEKRKLLDSVKGKDIDAMQKKINECDAGLQQSVKELSSAKVRRDEARKWARELAEHLGKCPVCERELDEKTRKMLMSQKDALIRELEIGMERIEAQIKKTEKDISESKKESDSLKLANSKLADYGNVEEAMEKAAAQAKACKANHNEIEKSMEKLSKDRDAIGKELSALKIKEDALKRMEKHERDVKDLSERLDKKKGEAKEIDFDEKQLYKLQETITKESSSLSDMNAKIQSSERYARSIDSQIEDKAKAIASLNLIKDRIERRTGQIASMNKFRSALVETEAQLRNSLVTSINALMQNIWSELYPYADYPSIRLNASKDDYALEASINGESSKQYWVPIEGIASGGERSIASLTMRIALAMVIVPNLRWLILDEPTHNIDENGIGKFIEVLGNSLPKVVEQIFIITHDSALKNISSARVYQLDRDKNNNGYTSIVES